MIQVCLIQTDADKEFTCTSLKCFCQGLEANSNPQSLLRPWNTKKTRVTYLLCGLGTNSKFPMQRHRFTITWLTLKVKPNQTVYANSDVCNCCSWWCFLLFVILPFWPWWRTWWVHQTYGGWLRNPAPVDRWFIPLFIAGWWFQPLWKNISHLRLFFPIYEKYKMFQTTNQIGFQPSKVVQDFFHPPYDQFWQKWRDAQKHRAWRSNAALKSALPATKIMDLMAWNPNEGLAIQIQYGT